MHIAPTAFPGRLKRLPLFTADARLSFSPLVTSVLNLARWLALNPDQFLDDGINRLKLREAALGNDAVRGAIGFFKHRVGLRVPCDLFAQWRNSLTGGAAEPKKWPER